MAEMSIERLTEFAEAWNKSDPDLVASYFTDDGSFFSSAGPDPLGRGYHGKVGIRQAARDFDARYPGTQFQNLKVFVAGDVGILEWELVVPDGAGGETRTVGCDLLEERRPRPSQECLPEAADLARTTERVVMRFVLVHSSAVGPTTWRWIAGESPHKASTPVCTFTGQTVVRLAAFSSETCRATTAVGHDVKPPSRLGRTPERRSFELAKQREPPVLVSQLCVTSS